MLGELFALVSAGSFSMASMAIRRGMKTSRDNGTFMSTFVNMLLFIAVIGFLQLYGLLPPMTWTGFLLFMLAGLLTTFSGRSFYYAAIRVLGPSRAISFRMSSPIITVALAFTFLSERFSLLQFIGASSIIGGAWVLSKETLGRKDLSVRRNPAADCVLQQDKQGENSLVGILYALGSALSFGIGHFVRKLAVLEIPSPFWGMVIGTTAAWLAMVLQARVQGNLQDLIEDNFNIHALPWHFIISGVLNTAGQMFIYLAIFFTAVSVSQVLATSEILVTLLLSRIFLRNDEPLGFRVIACSLAVFFGVILMLLG